MKLICDNHHPEFDWTHCDKPATKFFIRHRVEAVPGVPLRPRLRRCKAHSENIFKQYFDEVSQEEYLISEIMDS